MFKLLWTLAKFVIVLVVVLAAVAGLRAYFGSHDGEPCTSSLACARIVGGQCLQDPRGERYCTYHCEHTEQCPRGWSCTTAQGYGAGEAAQQSVCMRAIEHAPEPAPRRTGRTSGSR